MASVVAFIMKHTNMIVWVLVAMLVVSQAFVIKDKNSRINELETTLGQTKATLKTCNGSIATLQVAISDEEDRTAKVNGELRKCYADMETIRQGYNEINTIMTAKDDEDSSAVKKAEVSDAPISNATNKLGIGFINKQFSAIE